MAIKKIQRSTFGIPQQTFPVPNINSTQLESYKRFWENDLASILTEFSPIEDTAGRWKITLGPEFVLEPDPELDENKALINSVSFSAPLYVNVTAENLITKEKKSQKVFTCKVPLMTSKGNFIINGVQKIVVGQLVKSPGVLFTRSFEKGMDVFTAKIIPTRGIWIDFTLGSNGVIYARIDRKKKFPATQLLKLFGIKSEKEIHDLFRDVDVDKKISYIQATLDKDQAFGVEDAVDSIYKKIRPGDIIAIEQGRKYLLSLFQEASKYDFGVVGRYKFNSRLGLELDNIDSSNYKKTLDQNEIILVIRELITMAVNNHIADDIDSLQSRRVRSVGEWMGNTFKAGLSRVVKNARDKMMINEDSNFTPAQLVNMRPLAAMIDDFFATSQLSRYMDQTNFTSEIDNRLFLTATGPGGMTRERAGFDVRDVHPSHYGRLCPINTPEGSAYGLNIHLATYSRVNKMGFMETPYLKLKSDVSVDDPELVGRIAIENVVVKDKIIVKKGELITKDVADKLTKEAKNQTVKVKKFLSNEVVWVDSYQEQRLTIVERTRELDDMNTILVDYLAGRRNTNPATVSLEEADLMDVSSSQILSLSASLVPFLAQTDGYRALMATNHQGQALPLVKPENPLIATGFEKIASRDSGYIITSEYDGEVISAGGNEVVVLPEGSKTQRTYTALKYLPSNNHSSINQIIRVSQGEKVKKGDILIEGFGSLNGEFAIGQNVRVAFMPFKGYNFEDSVVFSQRLVQQDKFTSVHIYQFTCDVHETRLGNEECTHDIPNVASDKLSKLGSDGIVHIGAYVESGDLLVGKITPKGESDLTAEDKLVRVLFGDYSKEVKDSSLYLEHGLSGKVISIRKFSRANGDMLPSDVIERIDIWLATTRKIKPGDKISGRHGNKSIVSTVLPVEDMPFTEDGQPIDVVLNPLGVTARKNLGQLLEAHLGLVCNKQGIYAISQPFNDISGDIIQSELEQAGYDSDGKMTLFDGQTGEPYDRKVVVGYLYLNKLHHLVDDKMHARSTGPYSLVTQQPLGGRSQAGGQRFGEMEVWALEAYGAAYALQEMLTIKSDDFTGRDDAFEAIIRNKPIVSPNLPGSFIVLANELTALGIKVNAQVVQVEDTHRLDEGLALSVDEGSLDKISQ